MHVHITYHGGVEWCGPAVEGELKFLNWTENGALGYELVYVDGRHDAHWEPDGYKYYIGPTTH